MNLSVKAKLLLILLKVERLGLTLLFMHVLGPIFGIKAYLSVGSCSIIFSTWVKFRSQQMKVSSYLQKNGSQRNWNHNHLKDIARVSKAIRAVHFHSQTLTWSLKHIDSRRGPPAWRAL